MYKLLLCLRYLRTRYLAFICIISVMLGVATLIVVNSVMSGFGNKLKDRLHGILADVIVETDRSEGFAETPEAMIERIHASPAGEYIEAASPTVEVFALLQFEYYDHYGKPVPITKQVRLIGVDPAKHAHTGNFSEYLVRQKNAPAPSFDLDESAKERFERNRLRTEWDAKMIAPPVRQSNQLESPTNGQFLQLPKLGENPAPLPPAIIPPPQVPDGPPPKISGVFLGYSIAHYRYKDPETGLTKDYPILQPGDNIMLATVSAGAVKPVSGTFVVSDFFHSEMSEYDSGFVYVPLDDLQRMRGMDGRVNSIQLRLKDQVRNNSKLINEVIVPELRKLFPVQDTRVLTWEQHQGPLLAAIDIERSILNILLFMIVGVAGFSILAIFTMIVTEKFRDIGIMKALGASNRGVMTIFLSYGLLLGIIGCGLGTAMGLLITENINEIEAWIAGRTGQQIFDRSVYYFDRIPTNIEYESLGFVNFGAVSICVMFSVIPAYRAARLHPVRALRFE